MIAFTVAEDLHGNAFRAGLGCVVFPKFQDLPFFLLIGLDGRQDLRLGGDGNLILPQAVGFRRRDGYQHAGKYAGILSHHAFQTGGQVQTRGQAIKPDVALPVGDGGGQGGGVVIKDMRLQGGANHIPLPAGLNAVQHQAARRKGLGEGVVEIGRNVGDMIKLNFLTGKGDAVAVIIYNQGAGGRCGDRFPGICRRRSQRAAGQDAQA